MTPRKARELLLIFFGPESVNAFDPLWPETMLGVAPGATREQVMAAVRQRLAAVASHPARNSEEAALLADALRSVAAQMIVEPGAVWNDALERELSRTDFRQGQQTLRSSEPFGDAHHEFDQQARALIAARGISTATVAQLHTLAQASDLPAEVVERFLTGLANPPQDGGERTPLTERASTRPSSHEAHTTQSSDPSDARRFLLPLGIMAVLVIVGASVLAIIAITSNRARNVPVPATTTNGLPRQTLQSQPPQPETRTAIDHPRLEPIAEGPPDGNIFIRSLLDGIAPDAGQARNEKATFDGIATLRKWWPRFDAGIRAATVNALRAGIVDLAQRDEARARVLEVLSQVPGDPASPAGIWHASATGGLAAVLTRESELPPSVRQRAIDLFSAATGSALRRTGSTFDEAAADTLNAIPVAFLNTDQQPAATTKAQADAWVTAMRAALASGSPDEAARRLETAMLDVVERLLTSRPNASERQPVFDFAASLLAQVRFREGDPGRDRVLSWFSDQRLTTTDLHLITSAIATRSSASGVEPAMVLSPGATQADRDDLRARYAESWSRALTSRPSTTGVNADWYAAARDALADASQATSELEQLAVAARYAGLNQAAALRWRGLPGTPPPEKATPIGNSISLIMNSGLGSDGQWALRYLAESRSAAARIARISEFEQIADPGQVDCETLAEVALFSSGETRASAQRAMLKRIDHPAAVNGVLELLPRVRRNSNTAEFLGQFTLSGTLPVTSDRWQIHYRKALVERMLTLASSLTAVRAADAASVTFAEAWAVVAGNTPSQIQEIDGPVQSVDSAASAFHTLVSQIRQQVPGPTAMIHTDDLIRARAGRLMVASGLPQAFAANQVSATEALAVLIAAERPAFTDQCRALIDEMNRARSVSRSVVEQIRTAESTATRLWAIRLGEPL